MSVTWLHVITEAKNIPWYNISLGCNLIEQTPWYNNYSMVDRVILCYNNHSFTFHVITSNLIFHVKKKRFISFNQSIDI